VLQRLVFLHLSFGRLNKVLSKSRTANDPSNSINQSDNLATSANALMRGMSIDTSWLFEECMKALEGGEQYNSIKIDRSLVKAGRALNSVGEYSLSGEIFDKLLARTIKAKEIKLQLDSNEGLAISRFHLGDKDRAYSLLEEGTRLAATLRSDKFTVLFKRMKADFVNNAFKIPQVAEEPVEQV
jgi:tetratricopeptide (TPR) repeat protein